MPPEAARRLSFLMRRPRPASVFLQTVLGAHELLPDQATLEAVLLSCLDPPDDVLKIPSWTRKPRHLELDNSRRLTAQRGVFTMHGRDSEPLEEMLPKRQER